MNLTKQEVTEELNHRKQILSALVRRRRPLELQEAQRGLSTPPEVATEISSLAEQIRLQEEEIVRLETLAAEGQISLVEAEYRVMMAKTWDTPRGKPSLAGAAELELARLRMGLLLEKAQQVEYEVRVGLTEEAFANLDSNLLEKLPVKPPSADADSSTGEHGSTVTNEAESILSKGGSFDINAEEVSVGGHFVGRDFIMYSSYEDPYDVSLRIIGRAIRLDNPTALSLFLIILPATFLLDVEKFGAQLLSANRVWNYQHDKDTFQRFLIGLADAITEREAAPQVPQDGDQEHDQ